MTFPPVPLCPPSKNLGSGHVVTEAAFNYGFLSKIARKTLDPRQDFFPEILDLELGGKLGVGGLQEYQF